MVQNGSSRNKVYMGKEPFVKQLRGWQLLSMEWDRADAVLRHSNALFHSGIFSYRDDLYNMRKIQARLRQVDRLHKETRRDSVKPLDLKSNVISIFAICTVCISFALLVLILEICKVFFGFI